MDGHAESIDDKKARVADEGRTKLGISRNAPGDARDRRSASVVDTTPRRKQRRGPGEPDTAANHTDIDIYGAHPRDD